MKTFTIALMPGDGIGHEIVPPCFDLLRDAAAGAEAELALGARSLGVERSGAQLGLEQRPLGAVSGAEAGTIERPWRLAAAVCHWDGRNSPTQMLICL